MFSGIFIKSLLVFYFSTVCFQQEFAVRDSGQELAGLNEAFHASIAAGDTSGSRDLLYSILKILREDRADNITVSNSQYYIGVYYLLNGRNKDAVNWLGSSVTIREQTKTVDEVYAKCLFNLALAHSKRGDFKKMEESILKFLDAEKSLHGDNSPELLDGYSALTGACISLKDYSRAIESGNKALNLIGENRSEHINEMAILYVNIGISHAFLSDYAKAVLFLERAESLYRTSSLPMDENYINLLNSLASNYHFLGQREKSEQYFNKGISMISSANSDLSLNFLNSFAINMGNAGEAFKGEEILAGSLDKAGKVFGQSSREYCEVLKNYAEFLKNFKLDIGKSIALFEKCNELLKDNKEDIALNESVLLGYAQALSDNGENEKALGIIQNLLFEGREGTDRGSGLENPDPGLIEPNQWSLKLLKAKYRTLHGIYGKKPDQGYLLAAAGTSELIVSVIEKIRISISEEESRLVLGDRFRDSYLHAIRDLDLCYRKTGDIKYLNKAFEYSEKSKVAGLLASTRELRATEFHIPVETAELERRLKVEIGFYEARINEEESKKESDESLLEEWKELLLSATQKRDSLIAVFERMYPGYYQIKYNTEVISPEKIPGISGRNTNYLNYVVSDSLLHIFVVNRKYLRLVTVNIDSTFFNDIRQFRTLLSEPDNNARTGFNNYISTGYSLYRTVLEPVKEFLISNKLLISPDNILSYIPFEALPVSPESGSQAMFSEIPYLLKDYSVSYTYSATMLTESVSNDHSFSNSLVAFAPSYNGRIDVDSLMKSRQSRVSTLYDLKYARTEAEYVADLTGGRLYLDNEARESVFKTVAAEYDIIHLAMHTLLNDQDPMHSKMIFSQDNDSPEDGNLNTWEVYGIPLKAKMVILSSCNTGSGALHSGEGILSLARGFVYSGSRSVVMSMWEIEDRSGAEIVNKYYRNIRHGASKSKALRKARLDYLRNSDMLRSHPYFWASLVIYGNNTPIYFSVWLKVVAGLLLLLVPAILFLIYRKSR
ncbi:MAG: CHAT domain-containing tetratricopeptide repeat protein [Bacteroidales bacterium]|jgi:CHAT domain-containing protein|nr:CHAT domain-containing tetratricopeptide repeat protein [Bacteroidales bacterium]